MENPVTIGERDIAQEDISQENPGPSRIRRAKLIRKLPRTAIVTFAAVNIGLLVVGAGALDRVAFLITSLLTAFILSAVDPPLYVEFTLALWMFAPFIRRMAEDQRPLNERPLQNILRIRRAGY